MAVHSAFAGNRARWGRIVVGLPIVFEPGDTVRGLT